MELVHRHPRRQRGHGGWTSGMEEKLGKTGTITDIDSEGDVVTYSNSTESYLFGLWTYTNKILEDEDFSIEDFVEDEIKRLEQAVGPLERNFRMLGILYATTKAIKGGFSDRKIRDRHHARCPYRRMCEIEI